MLETQLKNQEARYNKTNLPFRSYVSVDSKLVTGQNPQLPKQVAQAISKLLHQ